MKPEAGSITSPPAVPDILPRSEEGLKTLEVTLAIERAARTKESVTLPLW